MISPAYKTFSHLISWGFDLLYHQFSWLYSFAAWIVSAGRWNDWIRETIHLVQPGLLLDIGCGQGVLLAEARRKGLPVVGLDESAQMLRAALLRYPSPDGTLIRGIGDSMPFMTGVFKTVTATFPAPYLFEPATLQEIRRVLTSDGKMVILLTATVTGSSLHERMIRFFGHFFGFNPPKLKNWQPLLSHFHNAGFAIEYSSIKIYDSELFFLVAQSLGT